MNNFDIQSNRCAKKKRYAELEQVPKCGPPFEPYACRICGGWHITSGKSGELRKLKKQSLLKMRCGLGIQKNGGRTRGRK